jgi:hypothetical protein
LQGRLSCEKFSKLDDKEMKSRERVIQVLNYQEPDGIPIDQGVIIVTSITNRTYLELERHLGLPVEEIKVLDYVQQLPYVGAPLPESSYFPECDFQFQFCLLKDYFCMYNYLNAGWMVVGTD